MSEYISNILGQLEEESSRKAKEEILDKHKNNKLFKSVLKYALDEHKVFYIKKIPEYDDTLEGTVDLDTSISSLNLLSERVITGNKAIETLQQILENCIPQERTVIERIIKKDLACGVSVATVNKVFGKNFVRTYPVMLASSFNDKNMESIEFPCLAQIKSDGMRINVIKDNTGKYHYRTRNGKVLETQGAWDVIFEDMPKKTVIDGEALVLGEGGTILDRKTGNGILNKIVKGTASVPELNCVIFVVWDIVPYTQFANGKVDIPYVSRYNAINALFPVGGRAYNRCRVSQTWTVETKELAEELFQAVLASGQEGIILKNANGIWENKRSKNLVKMKAEHDADLVVTDWIEGEGKYEGKMGALTVESSDGKLKVNVGSGFTDEQREEYTKENVLGKIVTVKYNELIKDKNSDTTSLFLPIFVELREDKDTANLLKELK